MKKIFFSIALVTSVILYAQKDELKVLKKLAAIEKFQTQDLDAYTAAISKLESIATTAEDKNSLAYYKGIKGFKEISQFGFQPTNEQIAKIFPLQVIISTTTELKKVLDFEKSTSKKVYTDEIEKFLILYKPVLLNASFGLNEAKKYKEASAAFYALYTFEPDTYMYLENAAVLAQLGEEYSTSEKYYREIQQLGFSGSGSKVFKSSNKEVASSIASYSFYRKDYDQAKKDYAYLVSLDPSDLQAQINEANCYYLTNEIETYKNKITTILDKDPNNATLQYNVGYLLISEDSKIVEEINANLKNDKKYKELVAKRQNMFKIALPYFEKAYQLDITNKDVKSVLKASYDILGMKDKAALIK